MTSRAHRFWRWLRSPRLAAWLLAGLAAFVLLGFGLPQRNALTAEEYAAWSAANPTLARLATSTGLDSAFTSPLFQLFVALLVVNLVACTIHRFGHRQPYPPKIAPGVPSGAIRLPRGAGGEPYDPDALAPRPRGWASHAPDADTVVLWRGLWGWRGSMLMHLGLIALVLGGLVSSLTRFSGLMVLTEGQVLPDLAGSYVSIAEMPRYGAAFTGRPVGLEGVRFTYENDTVTAVVARMRDSSGDAHDVRVNYPLHQAGKAYLVEEAGHAVALRITDGSGATVFESFVNLGESRPDGSADTIEFRGGALDATLVSDASRRGGTDPRRLELNDPLLVLALAGEPAERGLALRPGESGRLGEWLVEFQDARLWNRFMVRADSGRWITYIAFLCIVIGMAVRWFDPDALVVVRRLDGDVHVWSKARYGSQAAVALAERIVSATRTGPGEEVPT